jgi:hypothetical protein
MEGMPPMPAWPAHIEELRDRFSRFGYVRLPGILAGPDLSELRAELRRLEKIAKRRDFAMACMDGSPRRMTTLGGQVIAAESTLVPRLATDRTLLADSPSWAPTLERPAAPTAPHPHNELP